MQTRKHKLGLRHRPVPEKIATCGQLVLSMRQLPTEMQRHLFLDELEAIQQQAAADDQEVNLLRNQLAAALTRRGENTKAMETAAKRSALAYACRVKSEVELQAAGLTLEAPKISVGLPNAPTQLRAVPVASHSGGVVKLRWVRPVRHCFHTVEVTSDPSGKTGWREVAQGARASCLVRGLQPGVLYWFRVSARTATGKGPWIQTRARAGF